MNSIILIFFSATCAAFSNFLFRKNIENLGANHTAVGYLAVYYFFAICIALSVYPNICIDNVDFLMLTIGGFVGLLNSVMMLLIFHALKLGSSGLTFAFQNASAVFPGLILFMILGSDLGFPYTCFQFIGMIVVIVGLFLGTKEGLSPSSGISRKWLKYILSCSVLQILALTFIQARCVMCECVQKCEFFSANTLSDVSDIWFMLGQFSISFISQTWMLLHEKRRLQKQEILYGSLSGIAFFASTWLLLLATKWALPFEQGMLFPCFSISIMILCNIWAYKLYNEAFNFKTNILCSLGILIASSH